MFGFKKLEERLDGLYGTCVMCNKRDWTVNMKSMNRYAMERLGILSPLSFTPSSLESFNMIYFSPNYVHEECMEKNGYERCDSISGWHKIKKAKKR